MANTPSMKFTDRPGVNNHRANSTPNFDNLKGSPFTSDLPTQGGPALTNRQPPPIPSRQQPLQQAAITPYANYAAYNYPYNPGFGGMYGGYGGYGGYYNRIGDDVMTGGFAQQAELTTRQAFQSVETIVRAFGSIAMMLDSTYQAVFNSFRAVIGMADQFSRMRLQMSHIYSTLAFFRVLKWIMKKIKYIIRRLKSGSSAAIDEELWEESIRGDVLQNSNIDNGNSPNPTWPILLFFAIVMGGPWLLWKFFSSFGSGKNDKKPDWLTGLSDSYVGVAEFDFQARNSDELSFKRGTKIFIAPLEFQQPSTKDWLLASVDKNQTGLIPQNYVKVISKNRGKVSKVTNNTTKVNITNINTMDNKNTMEEIKNSSNSDEIVSKNDTFNDDAKLLNSDQISDVGLNQSIMDNVLGDECGIKDHCKESILSKVTCNALLNGNIENNKDTNDTSTKNILVNNLDENVTAFNNASADGTKNV